MASKKEIKIKLYNFWWLPVLVGCLVFLGTLDNDFTNWDDYSMIINNQLITEFTPANLIKIFQPTFSGTYQPIRTFSYALDYTLGGDKPFIYHLHNLLLFLLNVLLVYLIVRDVFDNKLAFWTALIFALHPIHVESVAWVAARKEVLSGLFFFLSFYLYIKYTKLQRVSLYLLSIAAFILALLSKPTTVVLPVVILVYDFLFTDIFREAGKGKNPFKRVLLYLPFWLPNILVIIYFLFFASTKLPTYFGGNIFWTLSTEASVVLKYLGKLILPVNLLPRYIIQPFESVHPILIISIIINLGLLAYAVYKFRAQKVISFSILWFYVALIPVANIVPISTLMADRYIYLPSFAFALVLAFLHLKLLERTRWSLIILLVYLIFLGGQTVKYSRVWTNSRTLWEHTLEVDPGHQLAHNQLGNYLTEVGDTTGAYYHFKRAVEIEPGYTNAARNLGAAALSLGRYDEALTYTKKALAQEPGSIEARYQLGTIYVHMGKFDRAIEILEDLLSDEPDYLRTVINLGNAYYNQGKFNKAFIYFQRAYELEPEHPLVIKNMAAVYYNLKNIDECIRYYKIYLEKYPHAKDRAMIANNIAQLEKYLKGRED